MFNNLGGNIMKKFQLFCLVSILTVVFAVPALAAIYYGNYTTTMPNNEFAGKMFITDDGKMKTENMQYKMITRADKKISWVVDEGQKTYSVSPLSLNSSAIVSMKIIGEIGRKKVGSELVNTIECEKYKVECKEGKKTVSMYQWLSSDYPFPIKAARADGKWSIELSQFEAITNLTESIFDLPAGFKKI
jgi:hypothetical protein